VSSSPHLSSLSSLLVVKQPLRPTISTPANYRFSPSTGMSASLLDAVSFAARRPFSSGSGAFPPPGGPTQAAGVEAAGREILLLPASRPLRAFLFTIPFYSSIPISALSYRTSCICTHLPARTLRARTQCVLLHPNLFHPDICPLVSYVLYMHPLARPYFACPYTMCTSTS